MFIEEKQQVDKQLIKKFLQNRCTPEEAETVIRWMHEPGFDQKLQLQIEDDLKQKLESYKTKPGDDLKSIYKNILFKDELDQVSSSEPIFNLSKNSSGKFAYFFRYAATILLVFTISYFLVNYLQSNEPAEVIETQFITKQNSKGLKSTIFLADGSVVNLNADSQIRYQEHFNDSSRTVYLKGEAFFTVARDSLRPFTVISDQVSVTALGTSFNVSSSNEGNVTIALATGKVKVAKNDQSSPLLLEPGQLVKFQSNIQKFTKPTAFSRKAIYGWKDGILYFKSADRNTVLYQLEKWYGIKFIYKNSSTNKWSYTGEFDNQSLKSVLESLSFSQHFKFEIKNKEVHLYFNK